MVRLIAGRARGRWSRYLANDRPRARCIALSAMPTKSRRNPPPWCKSRWN